MKKVLVVVDMQNDFLTGALGNNECRGTIEKVKNVVREGGYDYIFATQDTHFDNYMSTQEGKKLPVVHCIEGSEGWRVEASIAEELNKAGEKCTVKYISKKTFGSTDLGEELRNIEKCSEHDDILQIDFVGVCTGICVISNALLAKAFVPEAVINVIDRACACVTPDAHKTAIEAMKTCQINII